MNPTIWDHIIVLCFLALPVGVAIIEVCDWGRRRRALRVRYLSVVGFLSDPDKPGGEFLRNRYQLRVYSEKRAGILPWRVVS